MKYYKITSRKFHVSWIANNIINGEYHCIYAKNHDVNIWIKLNYTILDSYFINTWECKRVKEYKSEF